MGEVRDGNSDLVPARRSDDACVPARHAFAKRAPLQLKALVKIVLDMQLQYHTYVQKKENRVIIRARVSRGERRRGKKQDEGHELAVSSTNEKPERN